MEKQQKLDQNRAPISVISEAEQLTAEAFGAAHAVINALVLCGAVPVYVNPEVDTCLTNFGYDDFEMRLGKR